MECKKLNYVFFFILVRLPPAVAFYPLTSVYRGVDVSISKNPPGILSHVRPAPGPNGRPGHSYQFFANSKSYIHFPNQGKLDTRKSITLLAWVNPEASTGPIFNYNPRGWGVHLWVIHSNTLFVRFNTRQGRTTTAITSTRLRPKSWNFVGASYDYRSGIARLFIDAVKVYEKKIGRFTISTNYPTRMGARIGDGRYFRGRITCMQVYDKALNEAQIREARRLCFRGMEIYSLMPLRLCGLNGFLLLFL